MFDFFGLCEKPFAKTPDPRFMYLSSAHREALARMLYGAEEKEIVVLTGEIGCGKTMLSRKLLDLLDDSYTPFVVLNPRETPSNFLRAVVRGFSRTEPRHYKSDLIGQIYEQLYALYQEGRTPVLIVDEAQLIHSKEVFEELRLITNFQLDDENLISIILIGQPELRDYLKKGNWEAFRQRVGFFYHLGPLTAEETSEYLRHRFEVAGGSYNPFTEEGAQIIHAISGGVPRVINHLATNALLVAFGRESKYIDKSIAEEATREYVEWS